MAIDQNFSARITLDQGSSQSVVNLGGAATSYESSQEWPVFTLPDTDPHTIPISDSNLYLGGLYLKNISATASITVGWTPEGGSPGTVVTLPPGGYIILFQTDPPIVAGGISSITLQASHAPAQISISASSGAIPVNMEATITVADGDIQFAFLAYGFVPVAVSSIDFGDGTVVSNPTPTGMYFTHTYTAGTYTVKVAADQFAVLDIFGPALTAVAVLEAPDGQYIFDANSGLTAFPTFPANMQAQLYGLQVAGNPFTSVDLTPLTGLYSIFMVGNPALASVRMPVAVNLAFVNFYDCALTSSAVNGILADIVRGGNTGGYLDLSGGTNAAPSGAGVTDAATLVTRGWTVTTN